MTIDCVPLSLLRRRRVDRRVDAEDAKATEHDRKGDVPADRSGKAEVESGKNRRDGSQETEDFFVVHTRVFMTDKFDLTRGTC